MQPSTRHRRLLEDTKSPDEPPSSMTERSRHLRHRRLYQHTAQPSDPGYAERHPPPYPSSRSTHPIGSRGACPPAASTRGMTWSMASQFPRSLRWYALGRLSQGKAAAIAGLSRAAFTDALAVARLDLGAGESQVIALAMSHADAEVILDDRAARR